MVAVAQLEEHSAVNRKGAGSTPASYPVYLMRQKCLNNDNPHAICPLFAMAIKKFVLVMR